MEESQKQVSILFTLIVFVIIALIAIYFLNLLQPLFILLLILIVLIVVYSRVPTFFAQLQEYERAVVFRMGRFKRISGPGWMFLIPFLEGYKRIDIRVRTYDTGAQDVITRDNIKLKLDAIVFMKVDDAKKAVINVKNYEKSAVSYVQANLRNVVGKLSLDHVIANVAEINEILQKGLQKISANWGINVTKVEVQSLELPSTVMESMHEKKAAEQRKFAAFEKAEARKVTIDAIQEAAGKLTDPTLQYMYLQALQRMAEGKSSKIIFPMELSKLASSISSKFGESYSKVEKEVVKRYREGLKEGKKPNNIIQSLKEEIGIEEKLKKTGKRRTRKV